MIIRLAERLVLALVRPTSNNSRMNRSRNCAHLQSRLNDVAFIDLCAVEFERFQKS
jgi:hypothetical protein